MEKEKKKLPKKEKIENAIRTAGRIVVAVVPIIIAIISKKKGRKGGKEVPNNA